MNESDQIIGQQYRIFDRSEGGMGVVFFCEDMESGEKIVLKTMKDKYMREKTIQRFIEESRIWLRLGYHPNIVWAKSVENFGGRPYIILEFAGLHNLRSWINSHHLDMKYFVLIVGSVCNAMDYAARKIPSIVHCDLKPENIVLRTMKNVNIKTDHLVEHISKVAAIKQREFETIHNSNVDFWTRKKAEESVIDALAKEEGKSLKLEITAVKVTDFGLARAIWDINSGAEGNGDTLKDASNLLAIEGTLPYMSPEQCSGRMVDKRSDIYSFGIVLYEMLTGRHPYSARSKAQWLHCHIKQPPEDMTIQIEGVPDRISNIVFKCLEKSPAVRYQSFQELRNDLQDVFSGTSFPIKVFEDLRQGGLRVIFDRESKSGILHSGLFLTGAEELAESGLAQIQMGRSKEGLEDLRKAASAEAGNVRMMERIVMKLHSMGQLDLALQFCDQGLAKNPDCRELRSAKSIVIARMGKASEAITLINNLIQEDCNHASIWTNKGAILCDSMNDFEGAVRSFDKALEIDGEFCKAWANRGIALSKMGRLKEALNSFERALEINPHDPDIHVGIGSVLQDDLGRSKEALEHFDIAVKLDPSQSMTWHCRGVALQAIGKLEEACSSYEQAIRVDGNNTWALWNLSVLFAKAGKYYEAVKLLKRIIDLEPDNKKAQRFWAECCRLRAQ